MKCMQEVGVGTDKNGCEIVGGNQYSSRSGSAGRPRMEKAGRKEGRDDGDVGREQISKVMVNKLREDGGSGWRELRGDGGSSRWKEFVN